MLVKIRVARHLYIPDLEGKNLYFGAGVHNVDDGLLKSFLAKRLIEKKIIVVIKRVNALIKEEGLPSVTVVERKIPQEQIETQIPSFSIYQEPVKVLQEEVSVKKEAVDSLRGRKKYKGSLADEDK